MTDQKTKQDITLHQVSFTVLDSNRVFVFGRIQLPTSHFHFYVRGEVSTDKFLKSSPLTLVKSAVSSDAFDLIPCPSP